MYNVTVGYFDTDKYRSLASKNFSGTNTSDKFIHK